MGGAAGARAWHHAPPEDGVSGSQWLAQALHDVGMLLYAGPMVAFAVLIGRSTRLPALQPWDVVRTFRAWGAGLGLAMGAWVTGLLARHWLQRGAFTWALDTPADQLLLASHVVFFVAWVWNVRVEVWSLEPLRQLDRGGAVSDPAAYSTAARKLARDLALQAALVLAYAALDARPS